MLWCWDRIRITAPARRTDWHSRCPRVWFIPSSLHNIIAEASTNQDIRRSGYGDLTCWAAQGILLLNATTLTVREGCANSHQKEGWATFTDHVIKCINVNAEGVVFLALGEACAEERPIY